MSKCGVCGCKDFTKAYVDFGDDFANWNFCNKCSSPDFIGDKFLSMRIELEAMLPVVEAAEGFVNLITETDGNPEANSLVQAYRAYKKAKGEA